MDDNESYLSKKYKPSFGEFYGGNQIHITSTNELQKEKNSYIPFNGKGNNFNSNQINKSKIVKKIKIIDDFYKRIFNKKPNIAVLGLNPHNFSSEEKEIIISAIKKIGKKGIRVMGPISPDTSFMVYKKYKIDVILGMYHDQGLAPFNALFEYNAINITLGLSYIRISPDHGVAENIVGKRIANPKSLIESIKFFNYIK